MKNLKKWFKGPNILAPLSLLLVLLLIPASVTLGKYVTTIPAGSFNLSIKAGDTTLPEETPLPPGFEIPDVKVIVFGYNKNYSKIIEDTSYTKVSVSGNIYSYTSSDKKTVYYLSDSKIVAPANCQKKFAGKSSLTTIRLENFDTSNTTDMFYMFSNCSNLTTLDISGFDTSKVKDMRGMFSACRSLTSLDLSSFSTDGLSLTNPIYAMFSGCTNLETIYAGDQWVCKSNMQDNIEVFASCNKLVGGQGTKCNGSDNNVTKGKYARIDGGSSSPGYFTDIEQKTAGNAVNLQNKSGQYALLAPISPAEPKDAGDEQAALEGSNKPEDQPQDETLDQDEPESESPKSTAPPETESSASSKPSSSSTENTELKPKNDDTDSSTLEDLPSVSSEELQNGDISE